MTTDECEQLCEAAGLNVRGSTQTVNRVVVTVGKDKRSSSTVITRLRRLAKEKDFPIRGIVFAEAPSKNGVSYGDDEYWFGVKA